MNLSRFFHCATLLLLLICASAKGQIDPEHRNLIELGYDQPLTGQGPQAAYAYYYYNNPDFFKTNMALRLAIAPLYLDSELGFKQLISPTTDFGVGINGGLYGDDYYEVRQGNYLKNQSFNGSGGGMSLNLYQLLNPGMRIPLNLVARVAAHYSTFSDADETGSSFAVPADMETVDNRIGLRFAGKEPVLYPDLGLELSLWFERQWRINGSTYGYNGDRSINPTTDLYWLYAGLNYAWTNSGQKISFAVTTGGSSDADRFSAWRLGGVLPLVSEFPLILPGYYYEELTATRFVHLSGSYTFPLDKSHRFQFRLEGAAALLDYLPGFEQPSDWQTGAGCGLSFTPNNKMFHVIVRYGYGFNAIRHGHEGSHSIGLLFQYDFEHRKKSG